MDTSATLPIRRCCIHCNISSNEEVVKPFTEESLKKCLTVLKVRSHLKLQYTHFKVPSKIDDKHGYHSTCYKRFTAIKNSQYDKVPPLVLKLPTSEESSSVPKATKESRPKREKLTSSTGVLRKMCLFCGKARKMYRKIEQKLHLTTTKNVELKVTKAASALDDRRILAIIAEGDFVAMEVRYHKICMKQYLYRTKKKVNTGETTRCMWHDRRRLNQEGFEFVYNVVEEEILKNEKVFTLDELYHLYKDKIAALKPTSVPALIRPQYLEERILQRFPSTLLLHKSQDQHIFFKSTMNFVSSVAEFKLSEMKRESLLRHAAYQLRNEIMINMSKNSLPSRDLSLSDVLKGECEIPQALQTFLEDVIYGPTTHRDNTSKNRRARSIASDIIFTTTNGKTKPAKQLLLGSAVKTITGSQKVVNILNRLGHSVSYSSIEEIETELSYSSHQATSIVPYPIKKLPNLFTSVAFDNFDRFVETLTGKNTLHDTVGIIFQNNTPDDENNVAPDLALRENMDMDNTAHTRRRRSFEEVLSDIHPYPRKPILSNVSVLINPQSHIPAPKDFKLLDVLWVLNFIHVSDSPMWVGFNSQVLSDESPLQTIAYLPQINSSPTSYAVVKHTLKIASQVMEECEQPEILCTYDLNIARMALEIQSQDRPQFDNIFVALGPFHVEMAMFKALGKYIDGSGILDVLIESGVLASGSALGFVGGTNYNRCRRVHRLLAVCLRKLHYDFFRTSRSSENDDYFKDIDIQKLAVDATTTRFDSISLNFNNLDSKLREHMDDYLRFEEETAKGCHGSTAQIWLQYVQYIDLYNNFNRSVRIGDVDLYVSSLCKINDLFFVMNHHNYARWLIPFTDNIIKVLKHDTHIAKQLKEGLFSVKRTNKSFSRTPIDLTLEQTINADAGNKLGGIISATNSISARRRWAYSHSQRTEIVSSLLNDVGLTSKEDITKDLRKGRIARDHEDFMKILEAFNGMINPFDNDLDRSLLFNICTGKSANENIVKFLRHVPVTGQEQHLNFRQECADNFSRFYKPIRRNVILNFQSDRPKLTLKKVDKTQTLKMERNLFGRLLTLSLKHKIDFQSVLKFPLTPVPLSLGHYDGTPVKTQKSVLLKYLEGLVSHEPPSHTDVTIIDGFYLLHLLGNNLPATYGGIAKSILKYISTSKCSCIHLIFDRYKSPSIKDVERNSRGVGGDDMIYHVAKSDQKRPTDFIKALRNVEFKQRLVNFLIQEWSHGDYSTFFSNVVLYVNKESTCYYFYSLAPNIVTVHEDHRLKSEHIEADSRMVFHITTFTERSNVVIRTSDTDVLVIILGNLHNIQGDVKMWLETGTIAKNDHRFIDIRQIGEVLGELVCRALPSLHALSGTDYTSAFFRIGKKRPIITIQNQEDIQTTLSKFGLEEKLTDKEFRMIEKLYRRHGFEDVDELRLNMFMDAYKKNSKKDPLKCSKGIEGANLPPCKKVLYQHVLRAKYVSMMWSKLNSPNPREVNPTNFGWNEVDGSYTIKWYEGTTLPEKLEEIVLEEDRQSDDEASEDDSSSDTSDDEYQQCDNI